MTLVTGASRGIGLALTRQLAARGSRVLATCRVPTVALQSLDVELVEGLEVTHPAAGDQLLNRIGSDRLELLIHNAGVFTHDKLDDLDPDALRQQWEVNALAPVLLTRALLPAMPKGAKVGLLSSQLASIAANTMGQHYGYRMSKAALNMAGRNLAADLAPKEIAVAILDPGRVQTDMSGNVGEVDADTAAERLLDRLDTLNPADSGAFIHRDGHPVPW